MRLFVFRCTVRRRPDSPGTADRSLFFFGAHAPVMRKHIHLHSLLCVIKLDIRIKPCILFAENCVKYWVETRGFAPEKLHLGLPFYGRGDGAGAAYDKLLEVEGIHSRTNFDLSQHEKFSGKKIQYFDPELNQSYVPYVIETSIGVDRMFLSVLCSCYEDQDLGNGDRRVVLHFPAPIAPVKCAVLTLVKTDGLPEKAREIQHKLRFDFTCQVDEKDSIGKRYRRQDAIGTPFCITVDHQTLEDNTVTLRHRDSMEQERVSIDDLEKILAEKVSLNSLLKKLI